MPFNPSALPDCRREHSRSLHSGISDVDRDESPFHSLGCVFLATGQLTYGAAIPEAITAPDNKCSAGQSNSLRINKYQYVSINSTPMFWYLI